ncbi:MAG TPA: hypothetical protein VN643_13815 [Pyrinomonadaceae bacterium]|nr:hypothetical protein [Pyrinomonadaceae bacterium]
MSKNTANQPSQKQSKWALPTIGFVVLAFIIGIFFLKRPGESNAPQTTPAAVKTPETVYADPNLAPAPITRPASEKLTMEVNKAVMVTAELDFGPKVPSIAQALNEIDRRYQPADGQGRTFAILDAYGEPTPTGKLHISMHVSSEKPGHGALVFRRTGEILWDSAITPVPGAPSGKNLTVQIGEPQKASWMVDGSNGATSILDAKLRDQPMTVRDFWPDGAERQVTFVYSACGCPVNVMVRRLGNRTVRTKELPVIFPDDPAAVETIKALMKW